MIKGLVICFALVATINLVQGYDPLELERILLENLEETLAEKGEKNVAEKSEKNVGKKRLEKKRTGKPNKLIGLYYCDECCI